MMLKLNKKKEIIAEISKVVANAVSVIAADYRGLTVSEITDLRANARNMNVTLKIVRNTLARIAFIGTKYESINNLLVGPIILAFSNDEPGATARLMRDFSKDHKKLEVKAISIDGIIYNSDHLDTIAALPTKDIAIAKLILVIQMPIANLIKILSEPQAKLIKLLAVIRDSKK